MGWEAELATRTEADEDGPNGAFMIRRLAGRLARLLRGDFRRGAPPPLPRAASACFSSADSGQWYEPVLLNPATIGRLATSEATLREVTDVLSRLEPDDYGRFVSGYYREGLERYGSAWVYADILSVLAASSRLLKPARYLEIGVRRGRSMAAVVAATPNCEVVGFDLWLAGYAGMDNPGPDFVRTEIAKFRSEGRLDLISGSSHDTVPRYFRDHPDLYFDLITVDGDHSASGATRDLQNVVPRLALGGVLVFDDIAHPHHPEVRDVWLREIVRSSLFRTWEFCDLGFGVGLAVRIS
jgi:predicted O-methyltransferase YrrM